ncbi:MAG TPA: hypothetical protein VGC24_01875, partial [Burkholderiaceae bacterium]
MSVLNRRMEWVDRLRRRFAPDVTVIDFDGLVLRLALARPADAGRATLLAQTTVLVNSTPTEMLARALAAYQLALKTAGLKAPRRAVLVTAQAVQELARLPVSPAKPRKAAQMRALLQADATVLAGVFAQSWSLEGVLEAQGVIDGAARATLEAQRQQEREQERLGGRAGWQSGQELAERMGLVNADQVDAAQRLLAPLQTLSGRTALAWRKLPGQEAGPPWNWLLTAMDATQRAAWHAGCAAAGLTLVAIYPRGGLTGLAWPEGVAVRLVERQHELVHQWMRDGGRLEVAQSDALPGSDAAALTPLLAVSGDDASTGQPPVEAAVASSGPDAARFAAAVQQALGQPLRRASEVLDV